MLSLVATGYVKRMEKLMNRPQGLCHIFPEHVKINQQTQPLGMQTGSVQKFVVNATDNTFGRPGGAIMENLYFVRSL